MGTVTVPQANPNDELTDVLINQGPNAIAAVVNGQIDDNNVSSISGSKIASGTIPASASDTSSNPETRSIDTMSNAVASGCVWSISSGLNGTMTAGIVYINGKRIVVATIASQAFPVSKDTYVSVDVNGTVSIASQVANNAVSPALPANSVWLAIVITNGTVITGINVGQIVFATTPPGPTVSSRVLFVSDTNGQLIYPTPNQRMIGYAQVVAATPVASSTTPTQVPGLSVAVQVPANRRFKAIFDTPGITTSLAGSYAQPSLWDGVVNAGTRLKEGYFVPATGGFLNDMHLEQPLPPTSGLKTYNLGVQTGGGGTVSIAASTTGPSYIAIELQ